jgi:hypothetical protein
MATKTWLGTSSNLWSTGSNWVGGVKPADGDDVVFDATGAFNNCRLDEDSANLGSFTIDSAYTATFFQSTDNKDLNIAGNATFGGGGTFSGSQAAGSLINIGGDWDYQNQSIWTTESGNVHLTGTGNIIPPAGVKYIRSITVDAGATYTYNSGGDKIYIRGVVSGSSQYLRVDGTLTVGSGKTIGTVAGGSGSMNVYIGAAGTLTGAGTVTPQSWLASRYFQITSGGTCDIANLELITTVTTGNLLVDAGQIASANVTFKMGPLLNAGTAKITLYDGVQFDGDVTIEEGPASQIMQFLNTSQNPSMTFKGDVVIDSTGAGTIDWVPGSGTINLTGTADQSIDFDCQETEPIVINKSSGTVTLANCLDADSFTLTDGELDTDGNDITTTNNFTITAGATTVGSNLDGSTWTVGGDLDIDGTDENNLLDLAAGASWDLNVTGTASAKHVDVAYSDASGGSTVEGLASTDSGNNVNWDITEPIQIAQRGGITINHGATPIVRQNSALSGTLTKSDRLTGEFTKEGRLTGKLAAKDRLTGDFEHE